MGKGRILSCRIVLLLVREGNELKGGGDVFGLGSGHGGGVIIYAKCSFLCWHSFLHIKFLLRFRYNYMQLLDVIETKQLYQFTVCQKP
jgi:hypothetical protein